MAAASTAAALADVPMSADARAASSDSARARAVQSAAHRAASASADALCSCVQAEDRRIARTKQAFRAALIELIEEKGYEALTVNDLCARANLNRGTFYNHFRDKEDMITAFEDDMLADLERFHRVMQGFSLKDLVKFRIAKRPLPFLVELFDYLREHGDFLHAVLGPEGHSRFAPRLRDAVCTDFVMGVLHERYRENPSPFVNYYVAFYASAYMGIIVRWIETGMQESSEEMARIAMRMLFIKPGESIEL